MTSLRPFSVVFFAMLTGCASMQPPEFQHLQQNRYAELRQVMEQKVPDLAQGKTAELVYLCFAYSKIRQYDRLFPCIEKMESNIKAGDTKLFWFDFTSAPALFRAVAQMEFGDYAGAVVAAERAVEQTAAKDAYRQLRIYALSAAGLAHALAGAPKQARDYATRLAAAEATGLELSDKYIGLARIHMALGEYRPVLDVLRRDDEENAFFKGMVDLVTGGGLSGESIFTYWEMPKRFMQYRAQLELGDVAAAKQGYDDLLKAPGTAQSADLYWIVLLDRGRIAESEGDPAAAATFYRRAVDAVEQQRATIKAEGAKIGFVGDKQELYLRLVQVLVAQGRHGEAFDIAERAKARALVDLLASRRQFGGARNAEGNRLLAQLQQAEANVALQDAALPGDARAQQRSLRAGLRQQLQTAAPELASLVTVSSLGSETVRSLLAADETLIEYFGGGDRMFAFVLTRNEVKTVAIDGRGLRHEVEQLRERLDRPDVGDPLPAAQALHRRLLAPLGTTLPSGRLVVVAHGLLHYVPFAALHDGSRFLVERHALRMLPSASVMRFLGARAAGNDRLLLLGNPDVSNPQLDLAYAQEEAAAIAKASPRATLLLRKEASETALKSRGSGFGRLHLASHGKFFPEAPLRSGLLLAPDGENDGMLTVDELYGLDFNADLVVLSACETALGKVAGGDDVVGFTRGFLFAGARAIVSSLWSVDDQATKELMVSFYGRLGSGDTAEALRQAQLAMLARYRHPFYWAAFQLTGDIR